MRTAIAKETFNHPMPDYTNILFEKNNFYELYVIEKYFVLTNNNKYHYFNEEDFYKKFNIIGQSGYEK